MSIFRPSYLKEGPGIDKNTPPKRGLALFFEILVREFWQLIKLNLLFVLYCLPLVTIGPALGAMSAATLKMVKDEPNDPVYQFRQAFRREFRPCLLAGLLQAAVSALLLGGLNACLHAAAPAALYGGAALFAALLLPVNLLFGYLYPILVTLDLPFGTAVKDALLVSLLCLRHSLPALAAAGLLTALWAVFFPLSLPAALLAGFSFSSFIWSFAAWSDMQRYLVR